MKRQGLYIILILVLFASISTAQPKLFFDNSTPPLKFSPPNPSPPDMDIDTTKITYLECQGIQTALEVRIEIIHQPDISNPISLPELFGEYINFIGIRMITFNWGLLCQHLCLHLDDWHIVKLDRPDRDDLYNMFNSRLDPNISFFKPIPKITVYPGVIID